MGVELRQEQAEAGATRMLAPATPARAGDGRPGLPGVDLIVVLGLVGAVYALAQAASRWSAPLATHVDIDLSPSAVPGYAVASVVRMTAAYVLSLAFSLIYGRLIASGPWVERLLLPILDILQSIPILSFMPGVVLALVALFPRSNVGLELAAIVLIFTSQALNVAAVALMLLGTQWYLLFNVIAGAQAIPSDLREAATIYQLQGWRRWRYLILPAVFPFLVTGMITATGGAWNASIVSKYVTFGGHTYQTVGLGALIADAANNAEYARLAAGTLVMSGVVVIVNRFIWRRLYRAAEQRYRLD
jgi:NitT/TauT family transport system permease protein